jgi:hypothetical protein
MKLRRKGNDGAIMAAMVSVTCPDCGKACRLEERLLGTETACDACGTVFVAAQDLGSTDTAIPERKKTTSGLDRSRRTREAKSDATIDTYELAEDKQFEPECMVDKAIADRGAHPGESVLPAIEEGLTAGSVRWPVDPDADRTKYGERIGNAYNRMMVAAGFGYLIAAVTLVCILFGWAGCSIVNLIDVAVMSGLSFGVSRGSRVCAVLLFLVYTGLAFVPKLLAGNIGAFSLFLGTAMVWVFLQAIPATFKYQK